MKAIVVVDNICDGHLNVAHAVRALVAVHIIPQADKPNIELHKEVVDQAPGVAVIPGEPGQVFHHHAVDFAAHHIGQEPLEVLAVGVRACMAVINIKLNALKFIDVLFIERRQQAALVFDAVAVILVLFEFFKSSLESRMYAPIRQRRNVL